MPNQTAPDFLIVGGAHMDQIGHPQSRLEPGQSNPGHLVRSVGGVAGNIARSLTRLDWRVSLSSIIGADGDGAFVKARLQDEGLDLNSFHQDPDHATATYTAIEDGQGSLIAAIADMDIYQHYPASQLGPFLAQASGQKIILADTNLTEEILQKLVAQKGENKLALCATSGPKANRAASILEKIDLLFCNESEAAILAEEYADLVALPEILTEIGVKAGVITKGDAGVTAWSEGQSHHLPAPPVKVRSTNGAGDCLTACILHGLAMTGSLMEALPYGMAGASFALMSNQAVPDMLSRSLLHASLQDTTPASS